MTGDTTPTIVAAANLSPVSPRPLHNTYALPQALPGLQSRAEDPDVVPLELDAFRTAEAAMAEPVPSQAVEEPTVESLADQTQDASISDDDDESFQYDDGENDNGGSQSAVQEQDGEQEVDDYARTFDSPAEKEQLAEDADADTGEKDQQPLQQQELVSNAAESMNISTEQPDQPDAVPAQTQSVSDSSILPSLADKGSPSIQPAQSSTATSSSVQKVEAPDPADNAQESTANFQEALPETVIASASPIEQSASAALQEGIENTGQPAQPAAALEDASVQSETKDVDMALDSAPDATALDIQKLVDEITAKADTPVAVPPTTASAATNPSPLSIPTASSMDVDMSSLPPKPALTQEQSKQTYSQAAYHHASLPTTPAFTTTSGPPPQPPYANNGAPGVSQPHNHKPSFSSYPNAYPPGTTPQLPTPVYIGQGVPQTYDEFLTEERKNMADAKWERFPDGSRIFIGQFHSAPARRQSVANKSLGNLSQERVSKRDVFDLFHRYGRLAQISLKSAYGFVQYHTVAEAQAAITNLQGIEVKGRNISKSQSLYMTHVSTGLTSVQTLRSPRPKKQRKTAIILPNEEIVASAVAAMEIGTMDVMVGATDDAAKTTASPDLHPLDVTVTVADRIRTAGTEALNPTAANAHGPLSLTDDRTTTDVEAQAHTGGVDKMLISSTSLDATAMMCLMYKSS